MSYKHDGHYFCYIIMPCIHLLFKYILIFNHQLLNHDNQQVYYQESNLNKKFLKKVKRAVNCFEPLKKLLFNIYDNK